MSFSTLLAGEIVPASKWATLFGEVRPLYARKTADQTVNNSTTLVNDTELFVSVAANAEYDMELAAVQNSNATANFKLNFVLPAGATWVTGIFDLGSSAANEQFGVQTTAGPALGITGAAADAVVWIKAKLIIAGTSGTVQFQWAQNTANASNTIVRAGSTLVLRRLA